VNHVHVRSRTKDKYVTVTYFTSSHIFI